MRLARVEQAAFGTGNRRASHCATTPVDLACVLERAVHQGERALGVRLEMVVMAYNLLAFRGRV